MKEKRLSTVIVGTLVVIAIILMGVLTFEIYFFRQYIHELVTLKEDYANYRQGLQRIIAEQQNKLAGESLSVKKKAIMKSDNIFSPVNRDILYLYDGARAYIRSQGLEEQHHVQSRTQWPSDRSRIQRLHRAKNIIRKEPRAFVADFGVLATIREHAFVLPIDSRLFRISSRFGPRRKGDGTWGFHYGVDLAAPYKTPVRAMAHGVIIEATRAKGFGNTVVVSHSNKLKTRYAHLARYTVKVGDSVTTGQIIGLVGNTGSVRGRNGIHLHIELLLYGKRIDPWYIFNELRRI